MKIGILADIHDHVANLKLALASFGRLGVDQVVTLGDAFDSFTPGDAGVEVARLLADAGAVGVWGNHDFGLSHDIPEVVLRQADPSLLEFSVKLKPQVVLDNCRFSHLEPWLNPTVLEELWFFDGIPVTPKHTERCFAAVPEQFLFIGHFHCWAVATATGPGAWEGVGRVTLDPGVRHLVVVAPVEQGWSGVFDTETGRLSPLLVRVT